MKEKVKCEGNLPPIITKCEGNPSLPLFFLFLPTSCKQSVKEVCQIVGVLLRRTVNGAKKSNFRHLIHRKISKFPLVPKDSTPTRAEVAYGYFFYTNSHRLKYYFTHISDTAPGKKYCKASISRVFLQRSYVDGQPQTFPTRRNNINTVFMILYKM